MGDVCFSPKADIRNLSELETWTLAIGLFIYKTFFYDHYRNGDNALEQRGHEYRDHYQYW